MNYNRYLKGMIRIKPYYGNYSYIRMTDITTIFKSQNKNWSYITVKGTVDKSEIYMYDKDFDKFIQEFEKEIK